MGKVGFKQRRVNMLNTDDEEVLDIDADPRNANWLSFTWELPPYKSPDFMVWLETQEMTLEQFRETRPYRRACEGFIIVNDEWVGPPKQFLG